jgi:hypothetical protein
MNSKQRKDGIDWNERYANFVQPMLILQLRKAKKIKSVYSFSIHKGFLMKLTNIVLRQGSKSLKKRKISLIGRFNIEVSFHH